MLGEIRGKDSGEPWLRLVYVHDFRCKHVLVLATSREKLIKITIHDIGFCCGALSQNVSIWDSIPIWIIWEVMR